MPKEIKNQSTIELGAKFTFPNSFFANVDFSKTLEYLNEGAKFKLTPEKKQNPVKMKEDVILPNSKTHNVDEGERMGVFDIEEEYVPLSVRRKRKQIRDMQFDDRNEYQQSQYNMNNTFIVNSRDNDTNEGIPIIDVPINIRPSNSYDNAVVPMNDSANGYRTGIINGQKVIYMPYPENGDMGAMAPFGFGTPNITLSPQNITIQPQTVTINPTSVTMNPTSVTMNPSVVTMNPEMVTMNPNIVTMNPETVTMNPNVVTMNPDKVTMNPNVVTMNPETVTMNPESVSMNPTSVNLNPETININSQNLNISTSDSDDNATEAQNEEYKNKTIKPIDIPTPTSNLDDLALRTRVIGIMKSEGVVFYDKSAEKRAKESGINYNIENKTDDINKNSNENIVNSNTTDDINSNENLNSYSQNIFDDRPNTRKNAGEPTIVEYGPSTQKPILVKQPTIFEKIGSFFKNILPSHKNKTNTIASKPSSNIAKKETNKLNSESIEVQNSQNTIQIENNTPSQSIHNNSNQFTNRKNITSTQKKSIGNSHIGIKNNVFDKDRKSKENISENSVNNSNTTIIDNNFNKNEAYNNKTLNKSIVNSTVTIKDENSIKNNTYEGKAFENSVNNLNDAAIKDNSIEDRISKEKSFENSNNISVDSKKQINNNKLSISNIDNNIQVSINKNNSKNKRNSNRSRNNKFHSINTSQYNTQPIVISSENSSVAHKTAISLNDNSKSSDEKNIINTPNNKLDINTIITEKKTEVINNDSNLNSNASASAAINEETKTINYTKAIEKNKKANIKGIEKLTSVKDYFKK